jgi:hypothetical protein
LNNEIIKRLLIEKLAKQNSKKKKKKIRLKPNKNEIWNFFLSQTKKLQLKKLGPKY